MQYVLHRQFCIRNSCQESTNISCNFSHDAQVYVSCYFLSRELGTNGPVKYWTKFQESYPVYIYMYIGIFQESYKMTETNIIGFIEVILVAKTLRNHKCHLSVGSFRMKSNNQENHNFQHQYKKTLRNLINQVSSMLLKYNLKNA